MKKIFVLAVTAAAMSLSSCGTSKKTSSTDYQYQQWLAQQQQQTNNQIVSNKSNERKALSGSEAKVNEWTSKGFSVSGAMGTFTMYDLLEMHNKKVIENQDHLAPVFGTGVGPDKTTARYVALANAATTYATAARSVVSGGMSMQFSNFGEQGLKLMGAYTQKVQEYITPNLKESVAVVRVVTEDTKDKGKYEFEIYYIVDEDLASIARKKAMDAALKETATEQIFGNAVDEWVKKFVSPEAE